MSLGLGTAAVVLVVLLWELARPTLKRALLGGRELWTARTRAGAPAGYDPGRERRAEQRARALLRSCVSERDWAMYRDLGFLRVLGGVGGRAHADGEPRRLDGERAASTGERAASTGERAAGTGERAGGHGERGCGGDASYAYLIYPHKPVVAYVPQTGALLNEYCVAFPDQTKPYGSARLPDSDDVLAKWMALTADERRLVGEANMHLPGRQVDPERVRRDLARLRRWEHERERARDAAEHASRRDLDNVTAA